MRRLRGARRPVRPASGGRCGGCALSQQSQHLLAADAVPPARSIQRRSPWSSTASRTSRSPSVHARSRRRTRSSRCFAQSGGGSALGCRRPASPPSP